LDHKFILPSPEPPKVSVGFGEKTLSGPQQRGTGW